MTDTTFSIDAARALAPHIREHSASIELERSLPEPIVRALIEAGIFKLFVPRAFDGGEVIP